MRSLFSRSSAPRDIRGRLAILVPTYRTDSRARHTIAATAAMANEDIAVIVADNSENADKHDFLDKLAQLNSNVHIRCHPKNIGAFANWRYLFELATLDYYLFIGDDDFCSPGYVESGLSLLSGDSAASAAAGTFLMVTSDNKLLPANGPRMEAGAADRITNFRIGGGNCLPNSMARRRVADGFLRYLFGHPLKASFFDWLMAYALLAQGKYLVRDKGHYLYDISNWENGEVCWKSNAKFYVEAGLPETFTVFHELYWAVESVHFFLGSYSPLAETDQRRRCAQFFFDDRMREFRHGWADAGHRNLMERMVSGTPAACEALQALAQNESALSNDLFQLFSQLLAAFDPNTAIAYLDYVESSLTDVQR